MAHTRIGNVWEYPPPPRGLSTRAVSVRPSLLCRYQQTESMIITLQTRGKPNAHAHKVMIT